MNKLFAMFCLAALTGACEYETIVANEDINHVIAGTWLYVEYGYSPGAGYYAIPIPADPPRTITFRGDFTMSSTDMGLEMYKYYRILEDTAHLTQVIAFFEDDPGNKPLNLSGLSPTYYTLGGKPPETY